MARYVRVVLKSRWDTGRARGVNGYLIDKNRNWLSRCRASTEGPNRPGQCSRAGIVGNRASITWIRAYERRWSNVGKSCWYGISDDNTSGISWSIVCRPNRKFDCVTNVWFWIRTILYTARSLWSVLQRHYLCCFQGLDLSLVILVVLLMDNLLSLPRLCF